MNKEMSDMWAEREQGTLAQAYSEMHRQDANQRRVEISNMALIISYVVPSIEDARKAAELLHQAGYRKP